MNMWHVGTIVSIVVHYWQLKYHTCGQNLSNNLIVTFKSYWKYDQWVITWQKNINVKWQEKFVRWWGTCYFTETWLNKILVPRFVDTENSQHMTIGWYSPGPTFAALSRFQTVLMVSSSRSLQRSSNLATVSVTANSWKTTGSTSISVLLMADRSLLARSQREVRRRIFLGSCETSMPSFR